MLSLSKHDASPAIVTSRFDKLSVTNV